MISEVEDRERRRRAQPARPAIMGGRDKPGHDENFCFQRLD
jgi:hypothetical protein